MKYRKFGNLGWDVSALGLGAMRFPTLPGTEPPVVDEENAIALIRYAIDKGINYIDTAYMYLAGQSETILGKALQDGYRDKVKLVTKMPAFMPVIETAADFDKILDEQLARLQTDKLDFYLLHGLNRNFWPKVRDLGVLEWAEKAMSAGRFDYFGFSFHDKLKVFKEIVDAYDNWGMVQVQYNFMDTEFQAGAEGVKYAADKGIGVVVMEPLRGGKLATRKQPAPVTAVWDSAETKRTPAEWALLWVLNQPEVTVALSGMASTEEIDENVASIDKSGPGMLTADELALVDRAAKAYEGLSPIPCTECNYCVPCQQGVAIPNVFKFYNEAFMYEDPVGTRDKYFGPNGIIEKRRADKCTECGDCVVVCPQQIDVPDWMKKVQELFPVNLEDKGWQKIMTPPRP